MLKKKHNITNMLKENINLQLESPRYEEGPLPAAEYWVPPPPLAAGPDPIQSPVTHHSKQRQIGTHKNMTTVFKIKCMVWPVSTCVLFLQLADTHVI